MQTVNYEIKGPVAIVTLERPKALNALNTQVLKELYNVFCELEVLPVKTVIVTGTGEKAFAAGADIAEMRHLGTKEARDFADNGHRTMNKIAEFPKPTIAAVNGYALGGGCELAIACDLRIAAENAKFGIPEVTLGVIPGFGGTQRLMRLIGKTAAMEMLLTGSMISADEAKKAGLVNRVVPSDTLLEEALNLATKIAGNSSSALAAGKKCMNHGENMSLVDALEYEKMMFSYLFSTADQKEGMDAFVEKRKAEFE